MYVYIPQMCSVNLPDVLVGLNGFTVLPKILLWVISDMYIIGPLVLTNGTAPCFFSTCYRGKDIIVPRLWRSERAQIVQFREVIIMMFTFTITQSSL